MLKLTNRRASEISSFRINISKRQIIQLHTYTHTKTEYGDKAALCGPRNVAHAATTTPTFL